MGAIKFCKCDVIDERQFNVYLLENNYRMSTSDYMSSMSGYMSFG